MLMLCTITDGLRIAAGSHDACVYIYDLKTAEDGTSSWQLHGKVKARYLSQFNFPKICLRATDEEILFRNGLVL